MLQAVNNNHDPAYLRRLATSVEKLAEARQDGKKHLLLAATGSVATIKIPNIVKALEKYKDLSIRLVLTKAAQQFLNGQSAEQPTVEALMHLPNVDAVYDDASEWGPEPWKRGASILHIELRRWADIMVVAPLSADALAKIVNGISDNLLLSVIRAWDTDGSVDGKKKRIIVCPAMNTAMWRHPVTAKHMRVIEEEWGLDETMANDDRVLAVGGHTGWFETIRPITKTLACGDSGDGAMASVDQIVRFIEVRMELE